MTESTFRFAFEPRYRAPARLFGVRDRSAYVRLTDDRIVARFGPWTVSTPLANVVSVTVAGPYRFLKTAGPPRLSISDRGLTFATNGTQGVCLEFDSPVAGIDPWGLVRHPNLTVTVNDSARLASEIRRRAAL